MAASSASSATMPLTQTHESAESKVPSRDVRESEPTQPTGPVANNMDTTGLNSAAAGGSGGPPRPRKYAHGFFDTEMADLRKLAFKILGGGTVVTILVMWCCLPFYWGSLWKSNHYTNKLTVRVINRDTGDLGAYIASSMLNQTNLKYFYTSTTEFPTDADVEADIVEEGAWAAIVIQPNAQANLLSARQNGNASYRGSSAVHVYYAQARQETAINSYVVPYIQLDLGQTVATASALSISQYLSDNASNTTALSLLAQAPTTVSSSVFYTLVNIRPYTQPVAQAITLVGLIYMLIFAFIITMMNSGVREIIAPFLTTKSYIAYRLATPLILYLPVSFLFSMINLPFKVDFGAHFTYAGGFFLWAFTVYLGMAAVGLSTEFAVTILGPKFTGFFLVPLIIANVSVASLPHELQPWIYRYGVAMPFYNVGRVVRTIIFNTKNEIGRNLGVLLGWIGLSLITISLATWLYRRNAVNEHRRSVGNNELDHKCDA